MSRLAFYRYAVPMALRNAVLRAQVWVIWARRVLRGLLVGRWPWEVIREIREEQRRIRAALDPLWKKIEAAVLGGAPTKEGPKT